MTDSAIWLPAHQQQADYHHHGNRHSHHQQPHHGATVKRLQGIRLLWKEGNVLWGRDKIKHVIFRLTSCKFLQAIKHIFWLKSIIMFVLSPYQFISRNLRRLVDYLLELCRGVDLRREGMSKNKGVYWKDNKHTQRPWSVEQSIWNITSLSDKIIIILPFLHIHKSGVSQMWYNHIHQLQTLRMEWKRQQHIELWAKVGNTKHSVWSAKLYALMILNTGLPFLLDCGSAERKRGGKKYH